MKSTKGFTLIELLTAIAVSALLLSILLPSLYRVRNMAREAKQKVQFSAIDQALLAWRNDYGEYPKSDLYSDVQNNWFCGAQKLAEALFGLDLLGYHPLSKFQPDVDVANFYPPVPSEANLRERQGRYLELEAANAYRLFSRGAGTGDGLIDFTRRGSFYPASYVLCDEFARHPITVGVENEKAGLPILYYRANTSSRTILGGLKENRIYNDEDNYDLVDILAKYFGEDHPLISGTYFYDFYIVDPKATQLSGVRWPYRPDSYILISAGLDGIYGTTDDITNFR